MFYTPSKQGLGETNGQEWLYLIEDFDNKSKTEIIAWLEKYLDLNTYEFYSVLRDSSLAPKGKRTDDHCLFDYDVMAKVRELVV